MVGSDDAGPEDREFGRQGWLLLVGIFLTLVVVPALIYLDAIDVISIEFQFAYLVLPLVPAVLLALLAVWVTTTT